MSEKQTLGFGAHAEADVANKKDKVLEGIRSIFRPEFLNRLDEILVFDPLTKKDLARIVDKMLEELQGRLDETGLRLSVTPLAKDKLLQVGMDVRTARARCAAPCSVRSRTSWRTCTWKERLKRETKCSSTSSAGNSSLRK
jgi:ATP-dependent Clp protease ATP-binding subunit ClpA